MIWLFKICSSIYDFSNKAPQDCKSGWTAPAPRARAGAASRAGPHWVAPFVERYLSNAASFLLCAAYSVKDHRNFANIYSPLLKRTCARQVVLDKWLPLTSLLGGDPGREVALTRKVGVPAAAEHDRPAGAHCDGRGEGGRAPPQGIPRILLEIYY